MPTSTADITTLASSPGLSPSSLTGIFSIAFGRISEGGESFTDNVRVCLSTPNHFRPIARPGMRWGWLALGLAGAVLAVATLVAFAGAHATKDVTGTVTVYSMSGYVSPGAGCENSSYQGAPVSIYDADNRLSASPGAISR